MLFDWVYTLVHRRSERWQLERAIQLIGRGPDDFDVTRITESLNRALEHPDIRAAMQVEDCSVEDHSWANLKWFDRAGIDRELAESMYGIQFRPETHSAYPDARPVLAALHDAGRQDRHRQQSSLRPPAANELLRV